MVPQSSHRAFEFGLLVLLSFLWGASFTLIEIAVETIPPATIVFGRLAIGAGLLWAVVFWRGHRLPAAPGRKRALLLQGLLQSALPFTLISWGQQFIDSGMAGLLNVTPPLFVFLIGFVLLGDRQAALRRACGTLIGLAGVLVILGPAVLAGDKSSVLGQLAVTAASLSYAMAALYAKRFSDQPPVLTAAWSMGFAALLMAPVSLLSDEPFSLAPAPEALLAVVLMGVFSTAVAMVLYFRLVRTLGALGVTSGSYLRAGFSITLGILLLGEAATASLALGLVMIFAGVAVVTGLIRWPMGKRVHS